MKSRLNYEFVEVAVIVELVIVVVASADNSVVRKWHAMIAKKQGKLKMEATDAPWTGRPTTRVRGASTQLVAPWNFQHTLLNCRWEEICQRCGWDSSTDAPPPSLFADIRQNIERQRLDGRTTLMTKSLVYWYLRDRCLCPEEHLLNQGWSDGANISTLTEAVEGWPGYLLPKTKVKKDGARRLTRSGAVGPALVDLAGNMMAAPDLLLVEYCTLLSVNSSLFANAPDDHACAALDAAVGLGGSPPVFLTPGPELRGVLHRHFSADVSSKVDPESSGSDSAD